LQVKAQVGALVTLGSPHNPPPANSSVAKFDQTRGLLKYIGAVDFIYGSVILMPQCLSTYLLIYYKYIGAIANCFSLFRTLSTSDSNFPGAFEKEVKYTSVIGLSIVGEKAPNLPALLAYSSYFALSGDGGQRGDGIIPVSIASLREASVVEIPEVYHSNYLPTPLQSIKVNTKWYGSEDVIPLWIDYLRKS
jgi:hypothetical protein